MFPVLLKSAYYVTYSKYAFDFVQLLEEVLPPLTFWKWEEQKRFFCYIN